MNDHRLLYIVTGILVMWGMADSGRAQPFLDATREWHMSDGANAAGAKGNLQARGEIRWGVPLDGAEREASLARGGDGMVARFDGGHLALADDADLRLNPGQWAIAIRMRDPEGSWRYPILGSYGSDKQVSVALRAVDGARQPMIDRNYVGGEVATIHAWMFRPGGPRSVPGNQALLEVVWGASEPNAARVQRIRDLQPEATWPNPLQQDISSGVMRPCFPIGLIGPTDWHDIVVTLTGPKLELWIDGVLVDEEYPIGETRARTLPFLIGAGHENGKLEGGFKGMIDHVAIWDRALSPAEIVALSGGAARARQRELAILGDEAPTMQYFRARGHNRKAGDLIPYWDARADTLRLFYLILRRNMHSKWDGGHGGLEIWQASTKDLKAWTHHPVTLPITEQWEAWNGTGAVAFHDGQYNWFYPTPDYDTDKGGVQRAVSKDGVTFTKVGPHPFLEGGDVEIFQTEDGLFHLIKAGPVQRASTPPLRDKTLVAWVRLADLEQRGGSVLTIEHPDGRQFDAIVFGEREPRRWMPGSDRHQRSPRNEAQRSWPEETSPPDAVVQMALVFQGKKGTLYRDGSAYAAHDIAEPVTFPSGSSLILGWRHTGAGPIERSYFRGEILDARVYGTALSAEQIAALRVDAESGPKPIAWYDFADGSTRDRTGNFPDGMLFGNARAENGALVLGDGDHLKVPGAMNTQARLTSKDLETWTEVKDPAIASDERLATCPNLFRFGEWHYYLCASGFWRSKEPFGPWTRHAPKRVDNLAVPKTAAFGKDRRIYAGFLADGGWGGNSILRELVQDKDGWLGTRFVPELIPASGDPLPITFEPKTPDADGGAIRIDASSPSRSVAIPKVPGDYRIQMEITPDPKAVAASFGIGLRASATGGDDGCDLVFEPSRGRARFTKMRDSAGGEASGPAIESVAGMEQPFHVDIIVRHDILDAEIAGFRSVTTRFWNPAADRIRLFVDGGTVTFKNIRIRPLEEKYLPYPGWEPTRPQAKPAATETAPPSPPDPLALNFHLMHPGGDSSPGDPNAAFFLDGTCHLHYILRHDWQGKKSFSFVHVTSPDMLHWEWQPTKLQPAFTGHGMFSGTGFLTKEGRPAAIYHGQASGRNQIAIAKDNRLSAWEKPYPVEVRTAAGSEPEMRHWDPDCFIIGDTYYAISGGREPPAFKSKDLKQWTYIGPFLKREMPGVLLGEDISCPNFFPIGKKWMLLCISHPLGCRYYIGDWDPKAEQFVPETHGRMNWRREDQTFEEPWRDFFAPESVLTPDGRRVMWAWLCTPNPAINGKTIQSLPRELSLPDDGVLRIRPLRESESLRHDPVAFDNITVMPKPKANGGFTNHRVTDLQGDAFEIRVTISRDQATNKQCGLTLFSDGKGAGLPLFLRPDTRTLRLGNTEAPFAVAGLPPDEDIELRIFIDKYLVEVFANGRQALIAAHMDWQEASGLDAYTWGAPTTFRKIEIWKLKPTHQGFLKAQKNRIWEPRTE